MLPALLRSSRILPFSTYSGCGTLAREPAAARAALAVASLSSKVTRPALTSGTVILESSKEVSKLSAVSLVTVPSWSTGAPLEKDGDETIDWSIWEPAVAKSWMFTLSRLTTSSRPCGSL